MNAGEVLYLSAEDVSALGLTMAEIIAALETMFVEKGEGRVEMPPKPGIHTRPDAFIHAMPAYIPSLEAAGMKWVSGYPDNRDKGLPYISGLVILNDPDSGVPISVMDATWITAMRTGAATAVAAKYLARTDSRSVGILACGVQGRTNLEALASVFDLERARAYDIDIRAAERFAAEMGDRHGLAVEVVKGAREAVNEMDLVVTSGPILKNPQPVIEAGWLAPGAFGCALDFDSYWSGQALDEVDKLATDDTGQMEYYRQVGYFRATPRPYADLGEIVTGASPGRESAEERVVCMNLGLALEDMVTAKLIYGRALSDGIGTLLPL
ncbi:MAG: ornithine cyclodeaminase family protein [Gemmatimonadales bacterium]|jgi:ornithine cyclodeaminase/alanine dehydrogenase